MRLNQRSIARKYCVGVLVSLVFSMACENSNSPVPVQKPGPAGGGDQIAAMSAISGLVLIDVETSSLTQLPQGGGDPSWNPDGTQLVTSDTKCTEDIDWLTGETYRDCDNGGLSIVDLPTMKSDRLSEGGTGEEPAWSPAGDEVAFVRFTSEGYRLFVMKLDGSPPVELDVLPRTNVSRPSWSPDGKRIAFWSYGARVNGTYVINKDGTGLTQISRGITPSWSPDGTRIAVGVPDAEGKLGIAIMAPDGSDPVRITEGYDPAWSPDGTRLAFTRNNVGLLVINVDGSNPRRLGAGWSRPAWRPRKPVF